MRDRRLPRLLQVLAGCALALCGSAVFTRPASADDPAPAAASKDAEEGARQVVGLFLKACVNFAGDRAGLRDWVKQTGLPPLPDPAQDAFLYGLPGIVYDATALNQKLVLVSEDNGSCSAVAANADGTLVIDELERTLKAGQVTLQVTRDATDAKESALRHREYTAAGPRRQWQMLVSIVQAPGGGAAMLTANPY